MTIQETTRDIGADMGQDDGMTNTATNQPAYDTTDDFHVFHIDGVGYSFDAYVTMGSPNHDQRLVVTIGGGPGRSHVVIESGADAASQRDTYRFLVDHVCDMLAMETGEQAFAEMGDRFPIMAAR